MAFAMDKLDLLESSLSWSEYWATMACGAVAIGLVIEYKSDFWRAFTERNIKLLPLGALLVTLGVALEFVFQVRTSNLISQVRVIQQKQTSDSNERVANAEKAAASAHERATKAEKETAELQNESQKIRMGRALFFSGNQCKEALKGRPAGRVEILWQRGVGDAAFLAFRFNGCLRGDEGLPRWELDNPKQVDDVPEGARPTGITVMSRTGVVRFIFRQTSDALIDVVGAALSAGLDKSFGSISSGMDRTLSDDTIRIFIGPIQ